MSEESGRRRSAASHNEPTKSNSVSNLRGRTSASVAPPPSTLQPTQFPAPPLVPFPQPAAMGTAAIPFTPESISKLPSSKKLQILNLINRFKARQLELTEFVRLCKENLGDKLYAQMTGTENVSVPVPVPIMQRSSSVSMPVIKGSKGEAQSSATDSSSVDVTKMDTSSLQDIIQYVGVDLKEEAENILKEHEAYSKGSAAHTVQDIRSMPSYVLNIAPLKALVARIASMYGITSINDECYNMITFAVVKRFRGLFESMIAASKHRVDLARSRLQIKIENDPRRQLVLPEKHEMDLQAAAAASRDDDANTDGGGLIPKRKGRKPSEDPEKLKKKLKLSEREDVAIKTKLANVTAMAALGLPQKSWMSNSSTVFSEDGGNSAVSSPSASNAAISSLPAALNIPSDRELALRWQNRALTVPDLLFVMEKDPKLYRSPLKLLLYAEHL